MLLMRRIRYLDTRDRRFKDRDLYLDTGKIDPAMAAAVEACAELSDSGSRREMLRYRQLFLEVAEKSIAEMMATERHRKFAAICVLNYFEDENGKELTGRQMGAILTGDPSAILVPPGVEAHDVELMLADGRPIPIGAASVSPEQLNILGYFARDVRELSATAFRRDGPATLSIQGNSSPLLRTPVTDDEIRSFVTIFRRLYMEKEPAGFMAATGVFGTVVPGHPVTKWVMAVAANYQKKLGEIPNSVPFIAGKNIAFTRKRLIDVFLYTQYAHQPDAKRAQQFVECLACVGGSRDLLTFLFLTEILGCAVSMENAGMVVAGFYDQYCSHHGLSPNVLSSLTTWHAGIGAMEKRDARAARILEEKAGQLAVMIWQQKGRPVGGHAQFLAEARQRLARALNSAECHTGSTAE